MIHKRNIALKRWVRKLLKGLNKFHSAYLTLNSNVDQDTYMFDLQKDSYLIHEWSPSTY